MDEERARLEVNGRAFPIVSSSEFTLDEWAEVQTVTGLRPLQFDQAIGELDPAAWKVFLALTIRRGGGTGQDEAALGKINLVALITDLAAAWTSAREEGEGSPLPRVLVANATASGEPETTSSENDGEPSGQETLPAKEILNGVSGLAASGPETTLDGSGLPLSNEPTPV